MENNAAPLQESNRLEWIDAARGFAIFGIFIVNIGSFSAPYFMYGGAEEAWTSNIDQATQILIDIFFQASFYTLFSILFGFGLQMMRERLMARRNNPNLILLRRLLILFFFGAIHAFLLWHGDILLSYTLVGILSLLILRARSNVKLAIGVFLMGVSVSFLSYLYYLAKDYLDFVNVDMIEQSYKNYLSNEIGLVWLQNYEDWLFANNPLSLIFLTLVLLPLFLFGMFIGEKRWLHEPGKYKSLLIKWWIVSLILFIGLKIGPYLFGNPMWFSYIQDNIGGMFSALFYIFSIALLSRTSLGRKILKPFTYVGRMALSNYILQSIISFLLFYGVGFGLYGKVGPFIGVVMVVIIYIGQILFSKWWFSRFRFGPLEWVWRSLTYWKRQPLLRR
jgi:uncharacterized protein